MLNEDLNSQKYILESDKLSFKNLKNIYILERNKQEEVFKKVNEDFNREKNIFISFH